MKVLRGGRIFDPHTLSVTTADVVIDGPRIAQIGNAVDGVDVVDISGRTILPGIIDCHVHVTVPHADLWRLAQTPFSYRFFQAIHSLRATLHAGITTVRDAGGADLGLKQAVADGLIEGPRVLTAINMISQTGGHNDGWLTSGESMNALLPAHPGRPSGIADGPDEARRVVRQMIRAGADAIKIATSGGFATVGDNPRHRHFGDEELAVIQAEASMANIPIMAHAHGASGVLAAVRHGARSIEHGVFLDDEAVSAMVKNDVWLVPTLSASHALLATPGLSEKAREELTSAVALHADSFKRAVLSGVKIAMGTDSGVSPHGQNLHELALMHQAGLDPRRCLAAATIEGARLLGLADDVGSVSEGKRADLVVVDGDPLNLVSLGDRVTMVIHDGRVINRGEQ